LFVVVDAVFWVGVRNKVVVTFGDGLVHLVAVAECFDRATVTGAYCDVVAWHGVVFLNRHLVALQGATW